ncbi:3-keto-5-aminohexanoate cleavage protein [Agaricicola taiwanensis]|uniref:3-keto-5-aminohexanoate cleavage protein n=1 Tax=Agaricicola taiwanensis TaxID=591372 RepID=A0A8J2YLL6_9RHOB|nr:3-keto-5-aminohexanoate cleavage protein [Agaricicola taiwanensis]GGE50411.1 3-keto-5-aminohexanoate cleavage protein [Agaricicola taiwanensis]
MGRKTILTCAVTGNLVTRDQHPRLPITPEEIATAAIEAGKAGAAVAHLHARDVTTGKGSMDLDAFREIVARIKDSGSDIIINLSTGEGGRFVPSDEDPKIYAPGTTLALPEKRVAHVTELKPEICTLDFNTMFSGSAVVINTPRNLEIMAEKIYAAGTLPEIEIFDSGDLHMCKVFIEKGIIKAPALFQIVLGVRYSAVANPETLFYFQSQLPKDSIWAAFGIGRHEFPMLAQAWLLGGHVRVGLEDNVYISKGVLARDNAELVEKGVSLVENLGGSIATPAEAREMLGLAPKG